MELRDRWAMAILPGLMSRYGKDGYEDRAAIWEAYKLADEALGLRGARVKEAQTDAELPFSEFADNIECALSWLRPRKRPVSQLEVDGCIDVLDKLIRRIRKT